MKSFTDSAGRTWIIEINVGAIKRVRALCDVNIIDIITLDEKNNPDAGLLEKLASDPVLLVDVIYAVCKPECDKLGVSDEEFGSSMNGDVIEQATHKLLEGIIDFFPAAKRQVFQRVLTATKRFEEAANKKLQMMLEDKGFEEAITSRLNELNDLSMNAQESAE